MQSSLAVKRKGNNFAYGCCNLVCLLWGDPVTISGDEWITGWTAPEDAGIVRLSMPQSRVTNPRHLKAENTGRTRTIQIIPTGYSPVGIFRRSMVTRGGLSPSARSAVLQLAPRQNTSGLPIMFPWLGATSANAWPGNALQINFILSS